mmetsp:Transcript_19208/g.57543  ORF Transcript_19208/g.57543 Transcript_19208/m.57543 type:complete len:306 (+) Transcript_19208:149-1066(+)
MGGGTHSDVRHGQDIRPLNVQGRRARAPEAQSRSRRALRLVRASPSIDKEKWRGSGGGGAAAMGRSTGAQYNEGAHRPFACAPRASARAPTPPPPPGRRSGAKVAHPGQEAARVVHRLALAAEQLVELCVDEGGGHAAVGGVVGGAQLLVLLGGRLGEHAALALRVDRELVVRDEHDVDQDAEEVEAVRPPAVVERVALDAVADEPLVVEQHELRLAGAAQLGLDVLREEVGDVKARLRDADVSEVNHLHAGRERLVEEDVVEVDVAVAEGERRLVHLAHEPLELLHDHRLHREHRLVGVSPAAL